MLLQSLNILNYRNIREASLEFAPKLNCFVGLNGQGKTNVLDAIYLLSFAKSAFTAQDSLNITHGEEMAFVQGIYKRPEQLSVESLEFLAQGHDLKVWREVDKLKVESFTISCGLRKGVKKQFRRDKKDYPRLIDHIGLIPLVMISPSDQQLIDEGSDERRRFMDVVISQLDRKYLDCLTTYNALLKQRNALLKQLADAPDTPDDLLEVLEWQMVEPAEYIYKARTEFFEAFQPFFERVYRQIAGLDNPENPDRYAIPENADNPGSPEIPVLRYVSQLQDRDLREAYSRTRQRDLILGWTSQGIHKDDLEMRLGEYPLKQVGSQGQQRTFVLAMKLAQALYLSSVESQKSKVESNKPILLLDDIFDRLDSERVERIVEMVQGDEFGQIFITDTDREHLTEIVRPSASAKIFHVEGGVIK
ncbi:MAG: DNA replication and repair protein RecF [Paludibacteraceae bacterium]|nr:DNA replication and repair protein RecF [Paludibacteraceae bacterium]